MKLAGEMDFNELFRSMFGFSQRGGFPESGSHPGKEGNLYRDDGFPGGGHFFGNIPFFFGGSIDGPQERNAPSDSHRDSPFGYHMFDMFRNMEEMFKSMEKDFGHFGSPSDERVFGIGPPGEQEAGSLRDKMLKEPDSEGPPRPPPPRPPPPKSYEPTPEPMPDNRKSPSFFGRLFGRRDHPIEAVPGPKVDSDLDDEVRNGDLDAIFGSSPHLHNGNLSPPGPEIRPSGPIEPYPGERQPRSAFKSVSVRTYRSADGRVEERKSVQDGRGNLETIVTRRLGDQEHTVTSRKDYTGQEEVLENYNNMDPAQKEEFDQEWRLRKELGRNRGNIKQPPIFSDSDNGLDLDTRRIFSNLFGQSFPGFVDPES